MVSAFSLKGDPEKLGLEKQFATKGGFAGTLIQNLLLVPLFSLLSLPAFALTGGPDTFGYTWTDSNDASATAPVYEWIEPILGNPLAQTIGSVVDLKPSVSFYGVKRDQMMISPHGYVTFNPNNTGLDTSNDCPFPAVPSSDSSTRIAVLHDVLTHLGNVNISGVFHNYFPESPHPHHRCGVHVITWHEIAHSGSSEIFSFQLLLFDNFDILMQYGPNPENGSGSSTGLQGGTIHDGLKVACNFAGGIPDNYAILFEPPTVVVDLDSDEENPAGGTSLREAWNDSASGTKLVFDSALNGATILRKVGADPIGFGVEKAISIDASALENGVTLSGGSLEAICVANKLVHFSNLIFRDASSSGGLQFGALTVYSSNFIAPEDPTVATVSECNFFNNEALSGGAIAAGVDSGVFVSNCYFLGNSVTTNGGAIKSAFNAGLSLYRCQFLLNEADTGGAISGLAGSRLTIKESVFSQNSSDFVGGAILGDELAEAEIEACLFSGNSSYYGGALRFDDAPVTISDSTFSGNEAEGTGSAIWVEGVDVVRVERSTFADNNKLALKCADGSTMEIGHSIFTGSTTSPLSYQVGPGTIVSLGYNLTDASDDLNASSDLKNTDAMLGPLAANGGPTLTHALHVDSPAIDASPVAYFGADQRGFSRYIGSGGDIGAYEFQGNLEVTTEVDEMVTPGLGLSLREAILEAAPGSVITFAPSLNGDTISLSSFFNGQGESLVISKDITVDASALASGITLHGFDAMRVLRVERASVSLVNVDIKNGSLVAGDPFGGGAGLLATGDSEVSFIDGSVRSCSSGNSGGGVAVTFGSVLTLLDSTVSGNSTTADGGGIHAGGRLTLQRVSIGNNTATGKGGGIAAVGGSTAIYSRCTIAQNSADEVGGGLYLSETPGSLVNLTVSGNVSGASGGGIYAGNSEVDIEHCTIADNRAASLAGGLVTAGIPGGGRPTLGHCIVAANRVDGTGLKNLRAFDQVAEPATAGYNLIDDDSFGNASATDLEERVAYLAPLANYGSELLTHALLAISPAIDAGDVLGDGAPMKDGRGYARVADGRGVGAARVDIGAHEAAEPVFVGDLLDVEDGVGLRSLRGAITAAENGGRILFRQSMNGGVIDLSTAAGGQGSALFINKAIQIDATSLSDGITVSAGGDSRVFDINGGVSVAVHALRVEDGMTTSSSDGGGFRVRGNSDLLLTHSSVSDNSARDGGGFYASGGSSLRLQNVTVSGNTVQGVGAAIALSGAASSATLEHCTVADQSLAGAGTVAGFAMGPGKLTLYSTVLAGNAGALLSSDDFANLTSLGYNLADDNGALIAGLLTAPGDQVGVNPNINVLQNDGGWAKVHRFLASSALRNAGDPETSLLPALSSNGGIRSVGQMDIGSEERNGRAFDTDSDGMPDYWENLWGFDITDNADASENPDLDGANNLVEFQNGTNPLKSDSVTLALPEVLEVNHLNDLNLMQYVVKTEPGIDYQFETSFDLEQWNPPGSFTGALGAIEFVIHIPTAGTGDRNFIRFSLAPVQ